MTFLACCYINEFCVLQVDSRPKKFVKDYTFPHDSDGAGATVAYR